MLHVQSFHLRQRVGRHRFSFSHYVVTDQQGVNSKVEDDNHVLLWDFDNTNIEVVRIALGMMQKRFQLPTIHVMWSNGVRSWHAYCLCRMPWRHAVEIVASTPAVDWQFFRYGVLRGAFTLRVTGKNGVYPREVFKLPSRKPESIKLDELKTFVSYEAFES